MSICTQWRCVAPADGSILRTGLDYSAIPVGLEMAGIAMTPDLWRDIQMIEAGAIAASSAEVAQ